MKNSTSSKIVMSRKEFLYLTSVLIGGSLLPITFSCSSKNEVPSDAPVDVWQKLLDALADSPDNLSARSKDIIKTKDPVKIFEFVRDNILTIPYPQDGRFETRWGIDGVLRCGMGTIREKAMLLSDLYNRANLKAKLVRGAADGNTVSFKDLFDHQVNLEFKPAISESDWQDWVEKLNLKTEKSGKMVAPLNDSGFNEMYNQIIQALPDNFEFSSLNLQSNLDKIYLVQIETEKENSYANPSLHKAEFGKHYCSATPEELPEEKLEMLKLSVLLKGVKNKNPGEIITLAQGEWNLPDVTGKRIRAGFFPNVSRGELIATSLSKARIFTAGIQVEDNRSNEDESSAGDFVHGDTITLNGDLIKNEDGKTYVNGKEIKYEKASPEKLLQIDKIEIEVDPGRFPDVNAYVNVSDKKGNPVNNLPAGAFNLKENEDELNFIELSNQTGSPHILMLFDYSGSMPEQFRDKGAAKLSKKLMEAIKTVAPQTLFKAAATHFDYVLPAPDEWISDPQKMYNVVKDFHPMNFGSPVWNILKTAVSISGVDLVIFITDGKMDPNQEWIPNDLEKADFRDGCPAVIIGAGKDRDMKTLNEMGRVAGGLSFEVENQKDVIAGIKSYIDKYITKPYLLQYTAPLGTPQKRKVKISVPGTNVQAETEYLAPQNNSEQENYNGWAGFYIETVLNGKHVQRILGGKTPELPLTREDRKAAVNALFGEYVLTVEGAVPTGSALFGDILKTNLKNSKLIKAVQSGDGKKIIDEINDGLHTLPYKFFELEMLPIREQEKGFLTYPETANIILHSKKPDANNHFITKCDILPFSVWNTYGEDNKQAYLQNIKQTLKLNWTEKFNYLVSTANILKETKFAYAPNWYESWNIESWKNMDKEFEKKWDALSKEYSMGWEFNTRMIVPENPAKIAYWLLDYPTGSIFGIIEDGSGGGSLVETDRTFNRVDNALDILGDIAGWMGAGPAFSFWLKLERAKLQHLHKATIAIITMKGAAGKDFSDLLTKQIGDVLNSEAKKAIYGIIPYGKELKEIEKITKFGKKIWTGINL